ncbi:MAG: 23S rRNA pseudouridine(1911/1915/1917) synthase RluD [Proteobacteria bacterium]|nr:23S rRNA pseudouridine(1911/1915/1917) synthase RluD [Pseudomonadota bacterium]
MDQIVRHGQIPPHLAGLRVDQAAAELFDEFSRAVLSGWIREGNLTLDGRTVKPKTRVSGGEALAIDARIDDSANWHEPQKVAFEVVFEDGEILVINKPAGVVVHPGAGNPDHTLVNGLLAHRPGLSSLPRAGIVHRLDKDTSGLMVVVATVAAHKKLVSALAAHRVRRRYVALVEGRLISGRDIDEPIGRHPQHRTRQAVVEGGRPARTQMRIIDRYRLHTQVAAELETGRTHQIRVHMAHIGHPLIGDRQYGARGRPPAGAEEVLRRALSEFPRQALHAQQLEFDHPGSGEPVSFTAPMPADLLQLIDQLTIDRQRLA